MPTLRDVAEMAGVSIATASHVVNNTRKITPATRRRVVQAIEKLSFVPNPAGRLLALQKGRHAVHPEPLPVSEISLRHEVNSTIGAIPSRILLLRLLRAAQPIARVELARRLNINRSMATDAFKPLISAGIVREETIVSPASRGRNTGRPPIALTFNGEQDYFIGVSLGLRRSQVGLTNLRGDLFIEGELFDTPTEPDEALAIICERINQLRERFPSRNLRAIGVSAPGPTDAGRGILLYAPHLGWRDVRIAEALQFTAHPDGLGNNVPVIVENDAKAAAMYEIHLRLRNTPERALDNFVLVRSGTGIGVGLVIGGEVYRGTGSSEGLAGEFGHTTIMAGGKPCVCGNRGCWERYASASAASALYMGDRLQLGGQSAPRYVEIVARAEAGEIRAQKTLERIGGYLGIGIANVIIGLGVPHVIISGRIVYGWKFLREPVSEAVSKSLAGKLEGWIIEAGEPKGAGLGGALEVAVEEFLNFGLNY